MTAGELMTALQALPAVALDDEVGTYDYDYGVIIPLEGIWATTMRATDPSDRRRKVRKNVVLLELP